MTESLEIAIAEDQPAILADLQETLAELGHRVLVAAKTGTELVEACKKSPPHLVIIEIRMPDMDGLAAAAQIYEDRILPVIIASAHSDAEHIERALDSHVLAYLVKPYTDASLSATISLVMRRFREFQGLRAQTETLRQALDDRKLIERAKGILVERGDLTEAQAFERLEKTSTERGEKLSNIARAIIRAEEALTPPQRRGD